MAINLVKRIFADAIHTGDLVDLAAGHIDVTSIRFLNVGTGMVRLTGTWDVTGNEITRDLHMASPVTVTRRVTS